MLCNKERLCLILKKGKEAVEFKENTLPKDKMNDFELIQGCIGGRKESWDTFVSQYSSLIYDSIKRVFRKYNIRISEDIIGDLHNDIFIILLKDQSRALKKFEGRNGCSLASYIRTIAVNRAVNYLKKYEFTISIDEEEETDEGKKKRFIKELAVFNSYDLLEKKDMEAILETLYVELGTKEQKLFRLCIDIGIPEKIAEQLNVSIDHFYVLKQRLIQKLKIIVKDKNIVRY